MTRLNVIRLSDVEEQEISWFWQPYIAYGKIILLDGDPECGKTYLALTIAAAITTGAALPDYGVPSQKREPANVLFMTGEDALADTIRPRFRKVSGDPEKFFVIQGLVRQEEGKDLHTSITLQDIPQLEQAMKEYKPKLLIVDPFSAFLGANADLHRDNEMRPILERLAKLADKYKCAVILIRHLNKTNAQAQYRGMGSIAISASARSILLAAKDPRPDEEVLNVDGGSVDEWSPRSRSLLLHVKCNITAKGPSFAYGIGEDGLSFGGTVDITPDEVLYPAKTKTPREGAMDFLQRSLSSGPKPVAEIRTAGLALGFSQATLDRASKRLDIAKAPSGFGKDWHWALTPGELIQKPEPVH
jgi:putative DNA primase/helicase